MAQLPALFSGVITQRQVEPGQTVAAGQTLFEIVDPKQLEIQSKSTKRIASRTQNWSIKLNTNIQGQAKQV